MLTKIADPHHPVAPLAERLAVHHPQPERIVARGAGETVTPPVRRHVDDDDVRVAQLGAPDHGVHRVEQRLVGAPVDRQGVPLTGGAGGLQVCRDVATAEGVDGLLRVADQHHGAGAHESPFDDLPLDRVGVLELVDHHDVPALSHPAAGRGVDGFQGGGKAAEQIVIALDTQSSLARLEFGQHPFDELHPHGRGRAGGFTHRMDCGAGVFHCELGDVVGLLAAQGRRCLLLPELGEVDVVDDFVDQVGQRVDQSDLRVVVAGDAE